MTALLSGFSKKVADRFGDLLLSPALAFWLGGLGAWVYAHSWAELNRVWRTGPGNDGTATQVILAAAALLVVAGSARMTERMTLPVLRLLEGYWPAWCDRFTDRAVAWRGRRIEQRAARWRELYLTRPEHTRAQAREFRRLNAARASVPPDPADRMPTAVGDLLRAAEARPRHRYGLDTIVCFPRLWLLLPDNARTDLAESRGVLDNAARLWAWSLLFVVWAPLAWWALLIAGAGMLIAYRFVLLAAADFGELLVSCFDIYRRDLHDRLTVGHPADPAAERAGGVLITALLERGLRP